MMSFYSDDTVLGTASLDAKGTATFSTSAPIAGKHNVKAVYTGSDVFAESTSTPLTHVVE
jgi:hypothetical protein